MKKSNLVWLLIMTLIITKVSCFGVFAQVVDKEDIKDKDKVDVVHYNVASGEYEYGIIGIQYKTVNNGTYLVMNEKSFKKTEGTITSTIKKDSKILKEKLMIAITEVKSKGKSIGYNNIDSESWPYSVQICPVAIPMLQKAGFDIDKYIWLGLMDLKDPNRSLRDIYISVPTSVSNGAEVAVKVVTPKKMSIRLEDGTVLKNGDSFKARIGEEVKFQMCSNNWDNNEYDDNGNGIAGTVVYTVKVSNSYTERGYNESTKTFTLPKGDKTLRTDVNKCFMAYKYHFKKGNYNKQTGIDHVVNTPIESLSVNLPLGSTITSDAYKALNKIDTDFVFIQGDKDEKLSYTDYYLIY